MRSTRLRTAAKEKGSSRYIEGQPQRAAASSSSRETFETSRSWSHHVLRHRRDLPASAVVRGRTQGALQNLAPQEPFRNGGSSNVQRSCPRDEQGGRQASGDSSRVLHTAAGAEDARHAVWRAGHGQAVNGVPGEQNKGRLTDPGTRGRIPPLCRAYLRRDAERSAGKFPCGTCQRHHAVLAGRRGTVRGKLSSPQVLSLVRAGVFKTLGKRRTHANSGRTERSGNTKGTKHYRLRVRTKEDRKG